MSLSSHRHRTSLAVFPFCYFHLIVKGGRHSARPFSLLSNRCVLYLQVPDTTCRVFLLLFFRFFFGVGPVQSSPTSVPVPVPGRLRQSQPSSQIGIHRSVQVSLFPQQSTAQDIAAAVHAPNGGRHLWSPLNRALFYISLLFFFPSDTLRSN